MKDLVLPDLSGVLQPAVDTFRRVASQIFEGFLDVCAVLGLAIDQSYTQIQALGETCVRHGWCLTPDFDIATLLNTAVQVNRKGADRHRLYIAMREYFKESNWARLELLVFSMSESLHSKRRRILLDCVHAVRMHAAGRFNAANVVVPTCITVIDGMLSDFAHARGIKNWQTKGKRSLKDEISSVAFDFDRPAIALIFDTLFATASYGKTPASGRHFNRHWISHGNWLEYGRLENVLRLFLMIRFLDYIIYEYNSRLSGSTEPVTEASKYSKLLSENFVAPMRDIMRERIESRGLDLSLTQPLDQSIPLRVVPK